MNTRLAVTLALVACKHSATTTRAHHEIAITVTAQLPGASPAMVASTVATPLERRFGRLEQLAAMESTSVEGKTNIVLELADGTDLAQASERVQQAIDAAGSELPADMPSRPSYKKAGYGGAVMRVLFSSETIPLASISKVADRFAQKLAQVAGVGRVETCGDERDTIHVVIDPDSLRASGKSLQEVRAAVNDPALGFDQNPLLRSVAQVRHVPTPSACLAWNADGKRVVAVTVTAQPGADLVALRERLEAVKPDNPPTIMVATLPRTSPTTYRVRWSADVTIPKRSVDIEDLLGGMHASQAVAELGEFDQDVAELHVVGEIPDLDRMAAANGVTLLSPSDHIVGLGGPDATVLETEAAAIRKKLKTSDVLGAGRTVQAELVLDRAMMAELGVVTSDVATLVQAVMGSDGIPVTFDFSREAQVPIYVKIDGAMPDVLQKLYVKARNGIQIPLSQIATVKETQDYREIIHHGQFPWIGVRVSGSVDDITAALAKIPVPPGTTREVADPQPH